MNPFNRARRPDAAAITRAEATNGRVTIEDREATEAAQEVAEATDTFALGAMAVETSAQAQQVADGAFADGAAGSLDAEERRQVGRDVFRLAWPAIAENALQTLMGIVDTAVVARLGTAALSGVGAAQQLIWVLTTALIAVSMGTTVLIARFTGSGEREKASAALKQSLILAALFGGALAPMAFLSHPMLGALGLTADAAGEGAVYLQISLAMSMLIVFMFVAGAAMRGAGDTRTPMLVTAFVNVINAVLAVELVFGGAKASGILSGWLSDLVGSHVAVPALSWIPEMGVAGSAWATVIARGIGTMLLLSTFLLPKATLKLWSASNWRPNLDMMWRILRIGIPSAMEQLLMSVGILIYSFIVIGMGEVVFATSRLALNVVFLSQMPGFGFSMAATTLVGQSLGAGHPHRARLGAYISTRSAIIWMGIMGVVFYFWGDWILRVFTDDSRLISLGAESLKVIAFYQPLLAVAFVLAGALRGAGDVRFPMWVTTIAVWLIRLPVGIVLGLPSICLPFTSVCIPGFGLGLPGVYGALIVESAVRAVFFFARFRGGKWERIKV